MAELISAVTVEYFTCRFNRAFDIEPGERENAG